MTDKWPLWVVERLEVGGIWLPVAGTTGETERDSRVRYQHMIDGEYPDFKDMDHNMVFELGDVIQSRCRIEVEVKP